MMCSATNRADALHPDQIGTELLSCYLHLVVEKMKWHGFNLKPNAFAHRVSESKGPALLRKDTNLTAAPRLDCRRG